LDDTTRKWYVAADGMSVIVTEWCVPSLPVAVLPYDDVVPYSTRDVIVAPVSQTNVADVKPIVTVTLDISADIDVNVESLL
jgi:hypothetical protein